MKNANKYLLFSLIFLSLFLAWTLLLIFIDVRSAGAMNTKIGLSSINLPIRDALGFNEILYVITDYLGLVPIICVSFFAVFGIYQAVKRKSIMRVDKSILLLGAFYIIVFGCQRK
jgi:undecaprenyl-diphosphatase